jgi:hypothetical protein
MTLKLGSDGANTQEVAFRFVVSLWVRKTYTHNWKKTQKQPPVGIAPENINDVCRAFRDARIVNTGKYVVLTFPLLTSQEKDRTLRSP